jgi:hypothetical protein
MPWFPFVAIAVSSIASAAISSSARARAAKQTVAATNEQTAAINAATASQEAEATKVRTESLKNAEDLKLAPSKAEEDARLESMKRRRTQTKTLLTDPFGDESIAEIGKKTLLGG